MSSSEQRTAHHCAACPLHGPFVVSEAQGLRMPPASPASHDTSLAGLGQVTWSGPYGPCWLWHFGSLLVLLHMPQLWKFLFGFGSRTWVPCTSSGGLVPVQAQGHRGLRVWSCLTDGQLVQPRARKDPPSAAMTQSAWHCASPAVVCMRKHKLPRPAMPYLALSLSPYGMQLQQHFSLLARLFKVSAVDPMVQRDRARVHCTAWFLAMAQ